jgi:hypothetical protein
MRDLFREGEQGGCHRRQQRALELCVKFLKLVASKDKELKLHNGNAV